MPAQFAKFPKFATELCAVYTLYIQYGILMYNNLQQFDINNMLVTSGCRSRTQNFKAAQALSKSGNIRWLRIRVILQHIEDLILLTSDNYSF